MNTVRILAAAMICSALTLSACQKKAETPPADTTTPDATAPATPDATMTPAGNTPAECQAYLDHVKTCTDKLSQSNAMVAEQMQKSADQARASWATITDQAALANACKQADASFASTSGAMGC
jgi:hypothetical protein